MQGRCSSRRPYLHYECQGPAMLTTALYSMCEKEMLAVSEKSRRSDGGLGNGFHGVRAAYTGDSSPIAEVDKVERRPGAALKQFDGLCRLEPASRLAKVVNAFFSHEKVKGQ
jgi:hypothetical protein